MRVRGTLKHQCHLTDMKFATATTLIAACVLGSVYGAGKNESDKLECHAIGKMGVISAKQPASYHRLKYYDLQKDVLEQTPYDGFVNPLEKFRFYACNVTSDKFNSTTKDLWFGQLRSVSNDTECLTTNSWVKEYPHDGPYGGPYYEMHPKGKNSTVKLEKCSTKVDDKLRFQWFAMTRKNKKGCNAGIGHKGHVGDAVGNLICPGLQHDAKDKHAWFCSVSNVWNTDSEGYAILKTMEDKEEGVEGDLKCPDWPRSA